MEETPKGKVNQPGNEECAAILEQKLADLHEDLGDINQNFLGNFAISLDSSPKITRDMDEKTIEEQFVGSALQGVIKARALLEENNVDYQRPPDFFAEMIKSDREMEQIRAELEEENQKIIKAKAHNLQRKVKREQPKDNKQKKAGVLMKPHNKPHKAPAQKSQ